MKWFAIPFSSGPHSVRPLHHDPPILGCPTGMAWAAEKSYPTSEVRGGGRREQPHIQGAVAVWVQEDLEELSHIEGQEGRW